MPKSIRRRSSRRRVSRRRSVKRSVRRRSTARRASSRRRSTARRSTYNAQATQLVYHQLSQVAAQAADSLRAKAAAAAPVSAPVSVAYVAKVAAAAQPVVQQTVARQASARVVNAAPQTVAPSRGAPAPPVQQKPPAQQATRPAPIGLSSNGVVGPISPSSTAADSPKSPSVPEPQKEAEQNAQGPPTKEEMIAMFTFMDSEDTVKKIAFLNQMYERALTVLEKFSKEFFNPITKSIFNGYLKEAKFFKDLSTKTVKSTNDFNPSSVTYRNTLDVALIQMYASILSLLAGSAYANGTKDYEKVLVIKDVFIGKSKRETLQVVNYPKLAYDILTDTKLGTTSFSTIISVLLKETEKHYVAALSQYQYPGNEDVNVVYLSNDVYGKVYKVFTVAITNQAIPKYINPLINEFIKYADAYAKLVRLQIIQASPSTTNTRTISDANILLLSNDDSDKALGDLTELLTFRLKDTSAELLFEMDQATRKEKLSELRRTPMIKNYEKLKLPFKMTGGIDTTNSDKLTRTFKVSPIRMIRKSDISDSTDFAVTPAVVFSISDESKVSYIPTTIIKYMTKKPVLLIPVQYVVNESNQVRKVMDVIMFYNDTGYSEYIKLSPHPFATEKNLGSIASELRKAREYFAKPVVINNDEMMCPLAYQPSAQLCQIFYMYYIFVCVLNCNKDNGSYFDSKEVRQFLNGIQRDHLLVLISDFWFQVSDKFAAHDDVNLEKRDIEVDELFEDVASKNGSFFTGPATISTVLNEVYDLRSDIELNENEYQVFSDELKRLQDTKQSITKFNLNIFKS